MEELLRQYNFLILFHTLSEEQLLHANRQLILIREAIRIERLQLRLSEAPVEQMTSNAQVFAYTIFSLNTEQDTQYGFRTN